jgi:hypothetical protein
MFSVVQTKRKEFTMFSLVYSIVVLALGLLVVSPVVAAEHTYPGSMCTRTSGGTLQIDSAAQAANSAASALNVVCPVVGPYNDLSGNQAEVFVRDMHFTQDVCCEARATNNGKIYFGSKTCSSGTKVGIQPLAVTPPSVGFTWTSRYFYCTVPPVYSGSKSLIGQYRY